MTLKYLEAALGLKKAVFDFSVFLSVFFVNPANGSAKVTFYKDPFQSETIMLVKTIGIDPQKQTVFVTQIDRVIKGQIEEKTIRISTFNEKKRIADGKSYLIFHDQISPETTTLHLAEHNFFEVTSEQALVDFEYNGRVYETVSAIIDRVSNKKLEVCKCADQDGAAPVFSPLTFPYNKLIVRAKVMEHSMSSEFEGVVEKMRINILEDLNQKLGGQKEVWVWSQGAQVCKPYVSGKIILDKEEFRPGAEFVLALDHERSENKYYIKNCGQRTFKVENEKVKGRIYSQGGETVHYDYLKHLSRRHMNKVVFGVDRESLVELNEKEVSTLKNLCQKKRREACYELATFYRRTSNLPLTRFYEAEACKIGHIPSCSYSAVTENPKGQITVDEDKLKYPCIVGDAFACSWLGDKIVLDGTKKSPLNFYDKACSFSGSYCLSAGKYLLFKKDLENAQRYFLIGCKSGDGLACGYSAFVNWLSGKPEIAIKSLYQGCDSYRPFLCHLTDIHELSAGELVAEERKCQVGELSACYRKTWHKLYGGGPLEQVKASFEKLCRKGHGDSCYSGSLFSFNAVIGNGRKRIMQESCDKGSGFGCGEFAMMSTDAGKKTEIMQKACDLGDGWSCSSLAAGKFDPSSHVKICRAGFVGSCFQALMKLSVKDLSSSEAEAVRYVIRKCRGGSRTACEALPSLPASQRIAAIGDEKPSTPTVDSLMKESSLELTDSSMASRPSPEDEEKKCFIDKDRSSCQSVGYHSERLGNYKKAKKAYQPFCGAIFSYDCQRYGRVLFRLGEYAEAKKYLRASCDRLDVGSCFDMYVLDRMNLKK